MGLPDDTAAAPPAASADIVPASVPVPPGLQGCGAAVAYATGDPEYPSALYQICWPADWNGAFIVYAHGYVSVFQALAIPSEAPLLAAFANSMGFAFASTSYRTNGLAIKQGVQDLAALTNIVRTEAATLFGAVGPVPVLAAGASEGGSVVTLAAERYPGLLQGVLSTCGPTGSFQRQIDYLGDFNVLFNYFFPSVFANPGGGFKVTPAGVAPEVIASWPAYAAAIAAAVNANPGAAAQLLKTAGVAVDPNDPASGLEAVFGILFYNVFATNDLIAKVGGRPFDNRGRFYLGSSNDLRLNLRVQRFSADAAARSEIAQQYETTGALQMQYVSLHTTGDEIVQFSQQPLYRLKALLNGSASEHSAIPIFRYGHCNFQQGDLSSGLALLLLKVGASSQSALARALPDAARSTFLEVVNR
jgi:hypothetical protein